MYRKWILTPAYFCVYNIDHYILYETEQKKNET